MPDPLMTILELVLDKALGAVADAIKGGKVTEAVTGKTPTAAEFFVQSPEDVGPGEVASVRTRASTDRHVFTSVECRDPDFELVDVKIGGRGLFTRSRRCGAPLPVDLEIAAGEIVTFVVRNTGAAKVPFVARLS